MISLLAVALIAQQERALEPGLTVWAWQAEERLARLPTVGEGQTPNAYFISETLNLNETIPSPYGDMSDRFVGEVRGWLLVEEPGTYRMRLTCDDGARLLLNGGEVMDTAWGAEFSIQGSVELNAGLNELRIPFYEDEGRFYLRLEWSPPGAEEFFIVPSANLRTEAGQTFVTSPGFKRVFVGEDPRRPGDGRPLEGVHPAFRLEDVRPPYFTPAVGGMVFLPNGMLAVSTWDGLGAVYLLSNLDGEVQISRYAEGLGEPLGINYIGGDLYVTQKNEVTRLLDEDGDGRADRYEAVAFGWPMSQDYHEFTFNLAWHDGAFWIGTSVPLKGGHTYYNPGNGPAFPIPGAIGAILRIVPESGSWEVVATGARTPNGMGKGPDGRLYFCDNQGSWLPASRLNLVRPGGFYGHQETPDGEVEMDPPVVWFPHGEIGNSPSEPVTVPDGPYRNHMLIGDVTHGGIKRVVLDPVDGVAQGALFRFTQGLEAGINRLVFDPEGRLYAGGIGSDGNWNHLGRRFGLQRLSLNGETAYEMHTVRATAEGFEIAFTLPVDEAILEDPANYSVFTYRYEPTIAYGGPKIDVHRLAVTEAEATDLRTVRLTIPGLQEGYVVHIRLGDDAFAQGEWRLWTTECWYTLNRIPSGGRR